MATGGGNVDEFVAIGMLYVPRNRLRAENASETQAALFGVHVAQTVLGVELIRLNVLSADGGAGVR